MIRRAAALLLLTAGCITGKVDYTPPSPLKDVSNSIVVTKKRADVWATGIPKLGKSFFVINNLDAASGLINVSYSGDPERYVDGGTISSFVENARGPRTYTFAAAKRHQQYEAVHNGNLVFTDRRLDLEGRANIVLEEMPEDKTRVTANVRYVLTKTLKAQLATGQTSAPFTETITFDSGGSAAAGGGTTYRPTGTLEQELLSCFADDAKM